MNYDVIIGIEIHLELKTKTKMFSAAPCTFNQQPNTSCNEIDLGFPGVLPSVNMEAVKKALQACYALGLNIEPLVRFDRKNYYYSDLPKGYQITQQFHPIGTNGMLEIDDNGNTIKVGIERIHMEEDTAKQFHLKEDTLIDFNRAGTPLIEIVSKPDLRNSSQVRMYLETLRRIFLYLDISDAKMEEGSMRCDINISLKPKGATVLGNKVEVKNLNSISNAEKAIEFEITRQANLLDNNQIVNQETRRYDEKLKETILMRKKEGNVDYKYFPEPNIFPIRLDQSWMQSIKDNLPLLPHHYYNIYKNEYNLNDTEINYLLDNQDVAKYFVDTLEECSNVRIVYNFITSELIGRLSKNNISILDTKLIPNNLGQLLNYVIDSTISNKQAKELLDEMLQGAKAKDLIESKNLKQDSNIDQILAIVKEVIQENPQSITDYKNGKDRALGFLVGQVMKKSKGQANPAITSKLVKEELDKA